MTKGEFEVFCCINKLFTKGTKEQFDKVAKRVNTIGDSEMAYILWMVSDETNVGKIECLFRDYKNACAMCKYMC